MAIAENKTFHWDKLEAVNQAQMSLINFFGKFEDLRTYIKRREVTDIIQGEL